MDSLATSFLEFFIPVEYRSDRKKTFSESCLERVDSYFYLGGRKACTMEQLSKKDGREKAILSEGECHSLARWGKILSYFSVVIPVGMLLVKMVLRSTHHFKVIDPQKKLEKGMNAVEATAAKIASLISQILNKQDHKEIHWLSKGRNLVFSLEEDRSIVYKMDPSGSVQTVGGKQQQPSRIIDLRFANMIKAKSVCLVNQLGLLVIPQAKKIKVESDEGITYTLIAERQLPNLPHDSEQEALYHICSQKLNETLKQLALFVAKTGFNDVTPRNIPILDSQLEGDHKKVGLIDLEHMEHLRGGLLGSWNGSCGLIGCASSEMQVDHIIAMARAQKGINITDQEAKELKERRLAQIEDAIHLPRFYARKGVTGSELLSVDIASLGLAEETAPFNIPSTIQAKDLLGQTGTIKLSDLAQKVVEEINELITLNAKDPQLSTASVKHKRFILLNTNDIPWSLYNHLGFRDDIPWSCTAEQAEEAQRSLWLDKIIRALAEKGHLFKLTRVNGNGYFIQA